MGLPSVVIGVLVYLLLSRSGPLGSYGLLFSPSAMILAQSLLVVPLIAAVSRQIVEDAWKEYAPEFALIGIGRPQVWGLAAFGQPGVEAVIDILNRELTTIMRHAGTPTIASITGAHVVRSSG